MLKPRYNLFDVNLPDYMVPHFLKDMFTDIMADNGLTKVYAGNPVNMLKEALTGISTPGMHLVLIEQKSQNQAKNSARSRYWAKGLNDLRHVDDEEIALTFRHIDYFLNYHMAHMSVAYMADDNAQALQGETFKNLGTMSIVQPMSKDFSIVWTYEDLVYSAIDGNEFAYAKTAEEGTFTIRLKFSGVRHQVFHKGVELTSTYYNHNIGN